MKRRRAVEQHGVILYYVFKSVPYFGAYSFDFLLCILDVRRILRFNKAFHNERLEKLKRHFLRKSALVNFKRRTDNDNGASRIVDTFTKQVLTETSLLTAKHLRKRFERTAA